MVLEFSAKNFMSIKDIQTFSFKAAKIDEKDNVLISIDDKTSVLPVSVIYGANASGKTNILNICNYIKLILNLSATIQQGDKLPFKPFKLDDELKTAFSEFQIVFLVDSIKYTYGFSLNENYIDEEYLYFFPKGRRSIIFERKNTTDFNFTIDKNELQTLSNRTLDNRLFLAVASEWKYEKCMQPFEWLRNDLVVSTNLDMPNWFEYTAMNVINKTELGNKIPYLLKMADPSITNISGTKEKVNFSDLNKNMPEDLKDFLKDKTGDKLNILSSHLGKSIDGSENTVDFAFTEESAGTRRFFELLGPFVDIILNGKVLIIDELDIKLHTNLTRTLVHLFQNPQINNKNAQLLFTTHDTNLLDLDIFRRDQIWFTDKYSNENKTRLYSLIELKNIRKDENTQKGYLCGKYGGLPENFQQYLSGWK